MKKVISILSLLVFVGASTKHEPLSPIETNNVITISDMPKKYHRNNDTVSISDCTRNLTPDFSANYVAIAASSDDLVPMAVHCPTCRYGVFSASEGTDEKFCTYCKISQTVAEQSATNN